ncbi:hypothetical protein SPBR_04000 [Sporothrix brasiliensis 5110]|uniref:Methyltransferase domain-containing protein n=1 Tax=Sporothrix brasiliensis 5110 TaxID=1398154 RepID=A0A0C2FWA4_9PEZI|nr:uncharacterized protein SPBR_04000 [Sporothrix brasiliensis 5110]KIH95313.1 hypothetical protein SPBR_04000 [Sporothrix brasiliensis 5110]
MADAHIPSGPVDTVPENLKARIKASYDAIAPVYNKWTVDHSPVRVAYLDQVTAKLRPAGSTDKTPLRVLELGCGAGRPVTEKLLRELGPVHVTANDISTGQLDMARDALGEHGEKVSPDGTSTVDWVEGDMMALAFPDNSLDAVVGFYSVIHLPAAEQATLLGRIGRWLKPGTGYFLANFSDRVMPGMVIDKWLKQDEGWMYWSGLGMPQTEAAVVGEGGLTLEVSKLESDDVDDVDFHWVIARKPE